MYKYPATTKAEMVKAIDEIGNLTSCVHIDRTAVNQQVGKLQSLASHLPEPSENLELNRKVISTLEDHLQSFSKKPLVF